MSEATVNRLRKMTYQEANRCIQCGYCLPVCPTYTSMKKESASPRGRIYLVKLAAEGKIDLKRDLAEAIDLCLGCRACETVCPVDVSYGHILENAKEAIVTAEAQEKQSEKEKIKSYALKKLFPSPSRMRRMGSLVNWYQRSGLQKGIQKIKLLDKISPSLAQLERALPHPPKERRKYDWGELIPARGKTKARVAFFTGCITDALLFQTNWRTIELLSLIGCEVVIPNQQTCCGALHAHQGFRREAKELAKKNLQSFAKSGADYYVNNAGGCGAMLREYDQLLAEEADWQEQAKQFSAKVRDISELLVEFGPLPYQKEWRGVVTYQDSCHLRNVQKVVDAPRQLLQSLPGATYVELPSSDQCCGSGGIYNLLHFEESMKILDAKMEEIKRVKATTIVTTNPGCYLQMRLGVERSGADHQIQTYHLVDLLYEVSRSN